MSFRSSADRFAAQASSHRAAVYSGDVDAQGFNVQIGATKFLAPFSALRGQREIEEQGITVSAHAVTLVPKSLGLTLALEGEVTHTPTGDKFHIVQIITPPLSPDVKIALRKLV